MSDKKNETSKKWRLCFSWIDGIASARMSVIVDLPRADQAGSPVAMIQSIADKFGIPLSQCSEASAERMERDSDDDTPYYDAGGDEHDRLVDAVDAYRAKVRGTG